MILIIFEITNADYKADRNFALKLI